MNPINEQCLNNEDIHSSLLKTSDETKWNGLKISSNSSLPKSAKTGNSIMATIKSGCNKVWNLRKSKTAQIVVGAVAATTLTVITVSLAALGIALHARGVNKNKANQKNDTDNYIKESTDSSNGKLRLNPNYAKAYKELERIFGGNGPERFDTPENILEQEVEPEIISNRLSHPTLTRPMRKGIRRPSPQSSIKQKSHLPSYGAPEVTSPQKKNDLDNKILEQILNDNAIGHAMIDLDKAYINKILQSNTQ